MQVWGWASTARPVLMVCAQFCETDIAVREERFSDDPESLTYFGNSAFPETLNFPV